MYSVLAELWLSRWSGSLGKLDIVGLNAAKLFSLKLADCFPFAVRVYMGMCTQCMFVCFHFSLSMHTVIVHVRRGAWNQD